MSKRQQQQCSSADISGSNYYNDDTSTEVEEYETKRIRQGDGHHNNRESKSHDVPSNSDDAMVVVVDAKKTTKQIERALQYWKDSQINHPEAIKDDIHDDIVQHLHRGEVLPIFHTICRPPNLRLFRPDTYVSVREAKIVHADMIRLSTAPVMVGECPTKETEYVGNISMHNERSYIPAFFQNDIGIFHVQDSNCTWTFSEMYTNIVTALVNTPATMIGEDMEVTRLVAPMEVDETSGHNLITRRLSRGVVADCFTKSKRRSTYTMIGNSGIGKSWTLIYALQQALFYENVCVLLCFQKDSMAIVCLRRNNQIYVWHNYDIRWKSSCSSNLFLNSNVLVLLDPREASDEGAAYSEGPRMLIMAVSNNAAHIRSIGKFTGDYARILSCYTDEEMKCGVPFMQEGSKVLLTMDMMQQRASIIGNLPRYVRSKPLYAHRLELMTSAVDRLRQTQNKFFLDFKGVDKKDSTVHDCLLAINVNLCNIRAQSNERDMNDDEEVDETTANESTGYDGQYVRDYRDRDLSIMSQHVLDEIATLSRADILSFWAITSTGKRSEMEHMVENLFWIDLNSPYQMRRYLMMKETETRDVFYRGDSLYRGKCQLAIDIRLNKASLGEEVFHASTPVVAHMRTNAAAIAFAGPYRRVYRIAVSASHRMSLNGLEDLFLASGHLDRNEENGELVESENAAQIGKIEYNWVVPEERESDWKNRIPHTILDTGTVVGDCLRKYLAQYILVMDIKPKESND